ncbi:unnamed protein product, partial [Nesidiocoris tenuis]
SEKLLNTDGLPIREASGQTGQLFDQQIFMTRFGVVDLPGRDWRSVVGRRIRWRPGRIMVGASSAQIRRFQFERFRGTGIKS